MAEIESHDKKPVPGVDYSMIQITDDTNLGTGTFKTMLEPNALAKINPSSSISPGSCAGATRTATAPTRTRARRTSISAAATCFWPGAEGRSRARSSACLKR